jgi:HlyD family secretion protein
MKKLIGFVLLLVAAGGGWWYYVKYGTPPEMATVNELTISRGDIVEFVSATGALEPIRRYDVGSQVSGVVQKIYVDYNDIVKEGQLLAEIDPQLLQVQVDIQTANVERQEGDIANQEVQLEDQKKQFERTKSLYERGLVNQQAYETAELAIKTREAQIASSKKSLLSVRQQLQQARLNVSYTKITSPANAVVVERRVDVGQTVQASMSAPSFFVLSTPLENLKLTAGVDEAEIGKIRPGMPVTFQVDAYGQKEFPGTVEAVRLNATNQNNVVTYPVFINVPNPNLELRPSMTASVKIILSRASDVVRIPNTAIRFRPTQDIYRGLGLTPPQAGQGRRLGGEGSPEVNNENGGGNGRGQQPQGQQARGGNNAGRQGQGAQPAANSAGQPPAASGQQAGQGQQARGDGNNQNSGGGRGGRTGGQGFNRANLTPEQMKAMQEQFGSGRSGRGGRGGNQAGGRGANAGQGQRTGGRGATPPAPAVTRPAGQGVTRIDELWAPIARQTTTGSVWKWDPATKALTEIRVRLGVSDGQFTELISVMSGGEVNVGDKVVGTVTLPLSMRPTTQQGNPLTGQPSRGMPGMGGMPSGGGGDRGGGGGGGRGR